MNSFLCSERIFYSFKNFVCVIDSLVDASLFETFRNDTIFSLHVLIQIYDPTGVEWFQIWQFWRNFDIGRVLTTF